MDAQGPAGVPGQDGRRLRLPFHGKILDHLGALACPGPAAALAELVANAWDADASSVDITVPDAPGGGSSIVVEDDGHGMTFAECQAKYMNFGYDRRGGGGGARTRSGRPAMGRRGTGKLAAFCIARRIRVETAGGPDGEETAFEMDIDRLRGAGYLATGGSVRATTRRRGGGAHGTRVTLSGLTAAGSAPPPGLSRRIAGRFLAHGGAQGFAVRINGDPVPESPIDGGADLEFPRDYPPGRTPGGVRIDGGRAVETLRDGSTVRWSVRFARGPIGDAGLRGIAVYASGKMAQEPFLFGLEGSAAGLRRGPHMFGQVEADHVGQMERDVVSADRQRINWNAAETRPLLEWGRRRTGELLRLRCEMEAERRAGEIEEGMSRLEGRLSRLGPREQGAARSALGRLAAVPSIGGGRFAELAGDVLAPWESGRLRGPRAGAAEGKRLPEAALLYMLAEASAAAALGAAEAARARAAALAHLEERIGRRALERGVRDHVASNPWMISPEWEFYRAEPRVSRIAEEAAAEAGLAGEEYRGRVGLPISSGGHLLVLEFMRPGLALDERHLGRCGSYVARVRAAVKGLAAAPFTSVSGLIVADKIASDPHMADIAGMYAGADIRLTDWRTMIRGARAGHEEILRTLGGRLRGGGRPQGATGGGGGPPAGGAARAPAPTAARST